jgi:small basic protein (TIGR04137 family)
MTLDKSLKVSGGSIKSRNVMTRVERLTRLKELARWKEGDPVLGIPKTRVIKVSLKKKKKVKGPEEDDKKKKKK